MIPIQPTFIPQPFAQDGNKNTIPASNSGANGLASYSHGFPQITETPLSVGGIPPQRKDFNGILYALSAFAFYAQSGCQYAYSNTINYIPKSIVVHNNIFYICIKENGVDSDNGVKATSDTEYWKKLIDYLLEQASLSTGVPIGTIIMWASSNNPSDGGVWLDCNGQSCSAYPDLVSILGSETVPDLRGLFPRCNGSQSLDVTINGTTTSQTFSGGAVGTKSADAIRNITGTFPLAAEAANGGSADYYTGAFSTGDEGSGRWSSDSNKMGSLIINFNASNIAPIGSENKPASVSLRFLIKAS